MKAPHAFNYATSPSKLSLATKLLYSTRSQPHLNSIKKRKEISEQALKPASFDADEDTLYEDFD